MKDYPIKIIPYSAHALLIQWPEEIDEDILQDVLAFKARLEGAFPEALLTPCYHSLLLVCRKLIKDIKGTIEVVLAQYEGRYLEPLESKVFEIPVDYQSEVGMDLGEVCQALNMSIPTFIEWHTSPLYTVFGLGFLPGFMYLGGLPEAIHYPRRDRPRLRVPAGAVGIGGRQTGIYPMEAPGGWQLIGYSDFQVIDRSGPPIFQVKVGDQIRFVPLN